MDPRGGLTELSLALVRFRCETPGVLARLITLPLLASCAHGDLIARIETSVGTVNAVLQFQKAPRSVANFMTLAQGTRSRLDPSTGAITDRPLYIGEAFFRTADNDFAKFAQTGSGTGSNTGSTGFSFKDEFDPSLTHNGYTLSMANSGPNTNGGQWFLTGDISIPSYDNRHTIFGLVPDAASRSVVDAIIAAGDDGSSILAITFERTDPEAIAFDEDAQGLPTISRPPGELLVSPTTGTRFHLTPGAGPGDTVGAYRSNDLSNWTDAAFNHVGVGSGALAVPTLLYLDIDDASQSRAFYHLHHARHPGAVAPSHMRSRTVTLPLSSGTYTFAFDASGASGTTTFTPISGDPFGGPMTLFSLNSSAHNCTIITDTPSINPRYLRIRMGADAVTDSLIDCHVLPEFWNGADWSEYPLGACSITR